MRTRVLLTSNLFIRTNVLKFIRLDFELILFKK